MLQEEHEHDEDQSADHEIKTHHDEPGDHHGVEEEGYHEGEIPPVNTSNVRYKCSTSTSSTISNWQIKISQLVSGWLRINILSVTKLR